MGLLDGIETDPQVAMGMGLLSAGGNSRMPVSLGQALGSGYKDMQSTAKEAQALAMQKLQMSALMRRQYMVDSALAQENGQPMPLPEQYGLPPSGGIAPGQTQPAQMPPQPGQPSPMSASGLPSTPGFASNPGGKGIDAFAMSGDPGMMKLAELRQARLLAAQTDITKLMAAQGIQPGTSEWAAGLKAAQMKATDMSKRLGEGAFLNSQGLPQGLATTAPPGYINKYLPDGSVITEPVPGGLDAVTKAAKAQQGGRNETEPISTWNPVKKQFEFTNKTAAAQGGLPPSSGAMRPGLISLPPEPAKPEDLAAIDKELAVPSLSPRARAALIGERANIVAGLQGGTNAASAALSPAPAPGTEKAIEGTVASVNNHFSALQAVNDAAPNTLAILDEIKKLAPKAITGTESDRLAYLNGLLAIGNVGSARSVQEATDLLNKDANRLAINQRISAAGGGSDALQALAEAANPNNHMNVGAIIKASNNIVGQVKMQQDLYRTLLPLKKSGDINGYLDAQQSFNSSSDPRSYMPKMTATLADIAATAKASKKTTAEVTKALKANGYEIVGE